MNTASDRSCEFVAPKRRTLAQALGVRNLSSRTGPAIALALASLGLTATAQNAQPAAQLLNVVQLSASASVELAQDTLQINMSTTREGTDATAVQTQLKQALDAALQLAKAQAAPGQLEVRTGNFSLYPRYDKQGKMSSWQGSAELILEGKDFPRVSAVAGKIQTLTLGQVSFSLSRDARLKVEADVQAQAIDNFKAKASGIARSFGFAGYTLREVGVSSTDQNYVPRPRLEMAMAKSASADSAVPVEAGKAVVSISVNGSVYLK